ncbi:general stress protein [Pseudonocardia sichuanensis]
MTEPGQHAAPQASGQTVLGSYATYAEAERVVDHLSDNGFPVERTAIAGRGLSSYEQVTGRLTTGRAALQGAVSGAVIGALLGWLFGVFSWVDPLISGLLLALYGLVVGAVLGAVLGALGHAMSGGRRDFSSVPGVRADAYEVVVDSELAARAAQMLDAPGAPGRGSATGAAHRAVP